MRLRGSRTIEEGNRFLKVSLSLYKMSLACPMGKDKLNLRAAPGYNVQQALCSFGAGIYQSRGIWKVLLEADFPQGGSLRGDTEIWVGLRKSIVGQMVRSFFAGWYLDTLKPVKMSWPKDHNTILGMKRERGHRNDFPVAHRNNLYQIEERTRPSKMIVHA